MPRFLVEGIVKCGTTAKPAHARPVGPSSQGLHSAVSSPTLNARALFADGTQTRHGEDS